MYNEPNEYTVRTRMRTDQYRFNFIRYTKSNRFLIGSSKFFDFDATYIYRLFAFTVYIVTISRPSSYIKCYFCFLQLPLLLFFFPLFLCWYQFWCYFRCQRCRCYCYRDFLVLIGFVNVNNVPVRLKRYWHLWTDGWFPVYIGKRCWGAATIPSLVIAKIHRPRIGRLYV